jgi:error-prone DNA polymerase
VSLRATGCWDLTALFGLWQHEGIEAVHEHLAAVPDGFGTVVGEQALHGAAESRSSRPVLAHPPAFGTAGTDLADDVHDQEYSAGGMGRRRVLVHASGFRQSPYSDIKPAGDDPKTAARSAPRKLWHASPGSSGP